MVLVVINAQYLVGMYKCCLVVVVCYVIYVCAYAMAGV